MSDLEERLQEIRRQYALAEARSIHAAKALAENGKREITAGKKQALKELQEKAEQIREKQGEMNAFPTTLALAIVRQQNPSSILTSGTPQKWIDANDPSRPSEMLHVGLLLPVHENEAVIPCLIPTITEKNLKIEAEFGAGKSMVENLLVKVLLSNEKIRIHLVDPNNHGTTLGRFGKADTRKGGVFMPAALTSINITQTFNDLAERIHYVSQNLLQGKKANLDEYNYNNPNPEAKHIVVVVDPQTFNNEHKKTLARIAKSGPVNGVTVVALVTEGQYQLENSDMVLSESSFIYQNVKFEFAPDESIPASILDNAVTIAEMRESQANQILTLQSLIKGSWEKPGDTLKATIGKAGVETYDIELGVKGAHPHMLVAGRTGSGKSSFLHSLITGLALRYSPQDLEFYLLDGKQGVEMRGYAPVENAPAYPAYLPHLKVAAVKSDIRTYMSVLEKVKAEVKRRAKICSRNGVTDIVELEKVNPKERLSRIVVVLDEFHVLLTDEQFGSDAGSLLRDLVKQTRAYGIHFVFATQSLGNLGARGENSSLFQQIGNRLALSCDDNVSEMILGPGNTAASKLTKPGEAIFNAASGDKTHNVTLQVAYVSSQERTNVIKEQYNKMTPSEKPFVFSGDSLSNLEDSPLFKTSNDSRRSTKLWLGNPVSIKEPTCLNITSYNRNNILFLGVGDEEQEDFTGAVWGAALSFAASHPEGKISIFNTFEGDPREESMLLLEETLRKSGIDVRLFEPGGEHEQGIKELVESTKEETPVKHLAIFVDGDSFNFGKELTVVLNDGPAKGIHVLTSYSSRRTLCSALGVTLPEKMMALFDSRVFMELNPSDRGAQNLGLPEKPANESERFTLWEARKPNQVEVFIPYAAPSPAEAQQLIESLTSSQTGRE